MLSTEGGYHGSTYGAMAASGQPEYRDGFGPLPAGFDTVPYGDADALDARLARDGAEIAAFIVEPIQGRRGAHAPPAGYLARARAACTRHGVALVADEIQTGLGRTGTLFACEREAVAPDILLVAKALGGGLFPLGRVPGVGPAVERRLRAAPPVDVRQQQPRLSRRPRHLARAGRAAARAARQGGAPARPRSSALAARHPTAVRAVRAHGLLAAIELSPAAPRRRAPRCAALQRRGLYASAVAAAIAAREAVLVLPAVGEANVLRFIPPLIMETSEIDRAVAAIDAVLSAPQGTSVERVARMFAT